MTVTINGTTGLDTPAITNNGAYTGDGISFADNAPSNSLVVNSSGNVGIGTSSPSVKLEVTDNVKINGANPTLRFLNGDAAEMYIQCLQVANGGRALRVFDSAAGSERMRIDSSGNLLVGRTTTASGANRFVVEANSATTAVPAAFSDSRSADGVSSSCIYILRAGSVVGQISTTNSATAYVTSSDYRLKENIQPMQGALAVVQQLNPVTYTWKADGSDGQGFIAHELQAVVPDCVTGEKDAVRIVDVLDNEGRKIGTKEEPVYQGIDTSFLVATLTKAIQELKTEVDDLKAQLEAK